MDPADVIAQALHDVWQPVEREEQFPSRRTQAEAVLSALSAAGFLVAPVPDNLGRVLERLESRHRGVPRWSESFDSTVHDAAVILRTITAFHEEEPWRRESRCSPPPDWRAAPS